MKAILKGKCNYESLHKMPERSKSNNLEIHLLVLKKQKLFFKLVQGKNKDQIRDKINEIEN